ncbi:unannotated protein [freshwater metagenome]|uniref:Unannotated protein n=1 Tax=freshwater metagenome TaxID=449393 RepID=A0A6J7DCJ2_9ZZZZ
MERAQSLERISPTTLESDVLADNIGNVGALLYLIDIRFPYETSHEPILRSGSTGLGGEPLVPDECALIRE